ncbi:MAG TPA: hypothetical protein VIH61_10280 [Waddliaceae bacterium]
MFRKHHPDDFCGYSKTLPLKNQEEASLWYFETHALLESAHLLATKDGQAKESALIAL